eukprot:1145963-Pelagomonas_calceolata.AAC.1
MGVLEKIVWDTVRDMQFPSFDVLLKPLQVACGSAGPESLQSHRGAVHQPPHSCCGHAASRQASYPSGKWQCSKNDLHTNSISRTTLLRACIAYMVHELAPSSTQSPIKSALQQLQFNHIVIGTVMLDHRHSPFTVLEHWIQKQVTHLGL